MIFDTCKLHKTKSGVRHILCIIKILLRT